MPTIRRVVKAADGSEEVWTPQKDENDRFILATKQTPYPINHAANQVKVTLFFDVIEKMRSGKFKIRMVNGRGAASLISPKSIEILD
jgi:hypothetical protein